MLSRKNKQFNPTDRHFAVSSRDKSSTHNAANILYITFLFYPLRFWPMVLGANRSKRTNQATNSSSSSSITCMQLSASTSACRTYLTSITNTTISFRLRAWRHVHMLENIHVSASLPRSLDSVQSSAAAAAAALKSRRQIRRYGSCSWHI